LKKAQTYPSLLDGIKISYTKFTKMHILCTKLASICGKLSRYAALQAGIDKQN
jgi:hypothetical protein